MAAAKVATITIPLLSARDTGVKFKQSWSITKSHQQQHQQASVIDPPKPDAKDDGNLDDSLTSLNWLQNLRIMRIQNPTPPTSPTPLSIQNSHAPKHRGHAHKGGALSILKSENGGIIKLGGGGGSGNAHRTSSSSNSHTDNIKVTKVSHTSNNTHHYSNHNHHNYHLHPHHHHHIALQEQKIDYKSNSNMKPPYSYSTLIWMAMKESKKHKMTLSNIYKWIKENFKYYQAADPSWQNSIRHNLSLNKCFQKVARKKDEPGKGGFWRIDPAHADELENGVFKRRRHNSFRELPIKIKTEPESEDESSYMDIIGGSSKHRDHHHHHHHGHSRKQSTPKKRSHSDGHRSHKSKRPKIARTQSMKPSSLLDDSIPSSVLKDEFSWNSIFESEIEIDGMRIKTEDILDGGAGGHESDNGSDSLEMDTPPPSEHDSIITAAETALDLSINGTSIKRPAWFEEQLKEMDLHPADVQLEDIFAAFDLPPSPAGSLNAGKVHPWAESRDNMNLDASGTFSELFDFGQMAEGVMPWQDNPLVSP